MMGIRRQDWFTPELKRLEGCIEVFITAISKTLKNISIDFIKQGAHFIQTNHSGMWLLGYHILSWIWISPLLSKISRTFLRALMWSWNMKQISSRTTLVRVSRPADLNRYHCRWELASSWIPKNGADFYFADMLWTLHGGICLVFKDNVIGTLAKSFNK